MNDPDKLTNTERNALDALFKEAQALEAERPPAALLDRIMADAASQMPAQTFGRPTVSFWDRLGEALSGLGGLPGASVMTASVALGLAFGYAGPESIVDLSTIGLDPISEFDADMEMFDTADFSFDESELLQ